MSFCGLTKGISPKICILCDRVIMNKRSFELFLCLDLSWNQLHFLDGCVYGGGGGAVLAQWYGQNETDPSSNQLYFFDPS